MEKKVIKKKEFNPRIEIFTPFKEPFAEDNGKVIEDTAEKAFACSACTACTACK